MTFLNDDCTGEFIVTDEKNVSNGVPIDKHYRDLSTPDNLPVGGRASAPGCPKNEGGYPWLQHENSRCYLAGTEGPCGVGEVWFAQNNSDVGACYCDCLEVSDQNNQNSGVVRDAKNPDVVCNPTRTRPRVFVAEQKKCFLAYQVRFNLFLVITSYQSTL